MKRYLIYEGNEEQGRNESDSFSTKQEAIKRAKIDLENARFSHCSTWTVHVIDRKTGETIWIGKLFRSPE